MKILYENFSIYEVEEIRNIFISELQNSKIIQIDFANVIKIDFSAIALLISLVKSCEAHGVSLQFLHLKDALLSSIHLCGADVILRSYYE